jgi:RNA polymerase sigma factor (sigma-70 family)
MAEHYHAHRNPRPKRRRSKDNPYTIYSVNMDNGTPKFFVEFCDGEGNEHRVELTKELYDLFDQFELEDLAQLNEADRHYERSELTEESLNRRATCQQPKPEEQIIASSDRYRLHAAISRLPETQRRRVHMYYFEKMTLTEIASVEQCKYQRIQKSLERAAKKIKQYLKSL